MKRLFIAALALAFAVVFAGAASADTKIAVVGPMTGQDAAFGEQLKSGAEMAIEDINKSGGVLGQPLEMTDL